MSWIQFHQSFSVVNSGRQGFSEDLYMCTVNADGGWENTQPFSKP